MSKARSPAESPPSPYFQERSQSRDGVPTQQSERERACVLRARARQTIISVQKLVPRKSLVKASKN